VEVSSKKSFKHLTFDAESLRSVIENASRRFPGGATCRIEAQFGDRSGKFTSLEQLLEVDGLPQVIHDFQLWMYSANAPLDKRLSLSRGFPDVTLSVTAENDDVWAYGLAEVLGRRLSEIEKQSSPTLKPPGSMQRLRNYLARNATSVWTGLASFAFGLVLSAGWFGGHKAFGVTLSVITSVVWVFGAAMLVFVSLPANTALSLRQVPTLTLMTRTGNAPPNDTRIADETLTWTKRNVLATIIGIVMGLVGVVGGVLLTTWLTRPVK
jgi:hypothetical protein